MRTLLLLRHAKAVPGLPGQSDRDRPLADRGHRDSALIGSAIGSDEAPDMVLCSPSLRTRETLNAVLAGLSGKPRMSLVESLYGGGLDEYTSAIADEGGDAATLMVIGHNPTIHELALTLADRPDKKLATKYPTGSLSVIAFEQDTWAKAMISKGALTRFLRPKDLGADDADD